MRTNYIISSKGCLYKINEDNNISIRRPFIDKDLHERVGLTFNGIRIKKYIHVLVAEAFIPNIENKPFVHHIDGNTLNNNVDNLMWVTKEEHDKLTEELHQYIGKKGSTNPSSLYTDDQISMVIGLLEDNKLYLDEISEITGVSISNINKLRYRKNSWDYLKQGHDISNYDKFKYKKYTKDEFDEFVNYKVSHPDVKLIDISKKLNKSYDTIKNWNRRIK